MTEQQQETGDQAATPAAIEPERKPCGRCKVPLLLTAFAKNATRPDGLQAMCRECMRAVRMDYRATNKARAAGLSGPTADSSFPPGAPALTLVGGTSTPAGTNEAKDSGAEVSAAQAQERERERDRAIETEPTRMAELKITAIVPSLTNPRKNFNPAFIASLAESIRTQGLAAPILVRPLPGSRLAETYSDRRSSDARPTHEIIAGEQRWRASQIAGLRSIPALVRQLDDEAVLQLQLVENLQRRDLHPMEEAEGYERLRQVLFMTVESIARRIGMSLDYVYNTLKLLDLEPEAREAFYADEITRSVAELVAKRPANLQIQLLKEVTAKDFNGDRMSFRKARSLVENNYMLKLVDAPFDTADAMLVPIAGACGPCPKRTGSNPQLFSEVSSRDYCTDTVCFAAKKEAHYSRIKLDAEARGQQVIFGKEAREIIPASGKLVGYTRVDDPQETDGKVRTLRAIMGDRMPTPTLVEHPTTHELIAVLPTSVVGQLLKAQGIAKGAAKESAADAERQALESFERAWRTRAVEQIHEETDRRICGIGPEVMRILAGTLLDTLQREQRQHVCKLLGIGSIGDVQGIQEAIANCAPGKLESLLLLLLIEHDIPSAIAADGKPRPTPRIRAVALDLGVELDAIRDGVREETREALQELTPAPARPGRPGRPPKLSADQAQAQIAQQLQALDAGQEDAA